MHRGPADTNVAVLILSRGGERTASSRRGVSLSPLRRSAPPVIAEAYINIYIIFTLLLTFVLFFLMNGA